MELLSRGGEMWSLEKIIEVHKETADSYRKWHLKWSAHLRFLEDDDSYQSSVAPLQKHVYDLRCIRESLLPQEDEAGLDFV